jgi:hypothetical protein
MSESLEAFYGAVTLRIMILSIMTPRVMTLSIMPFSKKPLEKTFQQAQKFKSI